MFLSPITTSNHHAWISFALVIGMTMLTGCGTGLTREAVGEPRIEQVIRERVPTGSPTVTLIPHDDELGWTLSVTHPHRETHWIQEAQDWETKRYVIFPPSLVLGLIQCPLGFLFSTITFDVLGADAQEYGCQRVLMREPVEGTVQSTTTRDIREEVVQTVEPLRGGDVMYGWKDSALPSLRVALDQRGQASLRLSHLLGKISDDELHHVTTSADPPRLEISQRGVILVSQELPVTEQQVAEAMNDSSTPLPTERFPDRLVMAVKASDREVQEALETWVLQQGWCLAAGSPKRAQIVNVLHEQYSGRVSDADVVPLGKWAPPTMMVEATLEQNSQGNSLFIRVLDIEAGETLGTVTASGPLAEWSSLVKQTTVDLEHLFRQAPRRCEH